MHLTQKGRRIVCLAALGAALLVAQDWQTITNLNGVDLSGLTPKRVAIALKLLRNYDCTCGCEMKVAECRVKDPSCAFSKGLSAAITGAVKEGKSENDALAAAKASRFGKSPEPPKLLSDPVTIPTAGAPEIGPANAKITLVEFSDFQCPYCYKGAAQLAAVLQAYPTQVKLIFKQYPLDSHSQAALAAAAAIAAHRQGKFWPLHDAMFANRQNLSRPAILAMAGKLGLDMKRFNADLDSAETKKAVAKDIEDGDRAGVQGTPTVYIDGKRYNGSLELAPLRNVLDAELKK